LNGQVKDIQLRRITETAATYYIGEVAFSGAETLVFEITATPAGSGLPISATLTANFCRLTAENQSQNRREQKPRNLWCKSIATLKHRQFLCYFLARPLTQTI
jgi:hypothetical protein